MRRLRILVQRVGAVPVVVAAGVVSAEACGQSDSSESTALSGGATAVAGAGARAGAAAGVGGAASGQGGTGIIIVQGGTGGQATGGVGGSVVLTAGASGDDSENAAYCATSRGCGLLVVDIPEPGVPAEPGQICAATVDPVTSNRAATITLEPATSTTLNGRIDLARELDGLVVGTPSVEIVEATNGLERTRFSNVAAVDGGFTFQATLPAGADQNPNYMRRMTLRAVLEIQCADGTQQVHAATDIFACEAPDGTAWVSSGHECCVCRVIAEMAPSPIVPGEISDELPLAQALRLRIIELARVGSSIVLLAENDGGDGLEYEWLASVGELERLAPDVVRWTLAQGAPDPLLQAAVSGPHAAAVASFAYNEHVT